MIRKQSPSEHLIAIQQMLDALPDEAIIGLPPINDREHLLIGRFVSNYSFVELNLRRLCQALVHAGAAKKRERFSTAALFETVKTNINFLAANGENDAASILRGMDALHVCLDDRNRLAHWASRVTREHDVLVSFTMDPQEMSKRAGGAEKASTLLHVIVPLSRLEVLEVQLRTTSDWLAGATANWLRQFGPPTGKDL